MSRSLAVATPGDADVDGLGLGVLAVFGDTGDGGAGAEEIVAPGGAVAADDIDDAVRFAELAHDGMEEIELLDVVVGDVVGAVIAEEVVELVEGAGDVVVADAVDDVEGFAGVEVVEMEGETLGEG